MKINFKMLANLETLDILNEKNSVLITGISNLALTYSITFDSFLK